MLIEFIELFTKDFMPHGHCYQWSPFIVWSHVLGDTIIALSYFSIPFGLFYFVNRRTDMSFQWVFRLFAVFILACGVGHLVDIWNIWNGAYALSAVLRIITAMASLATAIMLWPLIPKALALPSNKDLLNEREKLEMKVKERTAKLKKSEDNALEEAKRLRKMHSVMTNRESKMVELKKEINSLLIQLKKPEKYDLD